MERLHKSLASAIEEATKKYTEPETFIVTLISNRLNAKGLSLKEPQIEQLKSAIRAGSLDKLVFKFDEIELEQAGVTIEELRQIFVLNDEVLNKIEGSIGDAIGNAFKESHASYAEALYDSLKQQAKELLDIANEQEALVSNDVQHFWSNSINLLVVLNLACLQTGDEFNRYFRPLAKENADFVFEALVRLHARACQITSEIICLLKYGFADGAHARWRTLHEIAVMMFFIGAHGQEVAERFLLHRHITDFKEAEDYQKYHEKLGYPPTSEEVYQHLKRNYDELIKRFGQKYGSDYGWASTIIKDPNFKNIEASVSLDHLRPFYKLANLNVHAGAKGSMFRLGVSEHTANILLAGPSSFGLGDPGENAAYSITLCTVELLTLRPNLDTLSIAGAIMRLKDDTMLAFLEDDSRKKEGEETDQGIE